MSTSTKGKVSIVNNSYKVAYLHQTLIHIQSFCFDKSNRFIFIGCCGNRNIFTVNFSNFQLLSTSPIADKFPDTFSSECNHNFKLATLECPEEEILLSLGSNGRLFLYSFQAVENHSKPGVQFDFRFKGNRMFPVETGFQ